MLAPGKAGRTPDRIYRDTLYRGGREPLAVGSGNWQCWLLTEEAQEFVFRSSAGEWHRALRERRRNTPYWYVACRVGGHVQWCYLGPAQALDCARLAPIAAAIVAAREAVSKG